MRVPLLDLGAQLRELGPEIKAAVEAVVDSTAYVLGPSVRDLEARLADYLGVAHAIGVSSGTDALLIGLMALDVGPGDLVLTTTYSFFATAGAAARLGAEPVFFDIDPDSYNLRADHLAEWLRQNPERRKRVKAIVPVHLYGQCAAMDEILAVAREHNLPVLEDAAQAIGATYPGRDGTRKAGALGTMAAFSFFPSKNLGGIGDGGLIVTDDGSLADKLRTLRVHGSKPKYYHAIIGGNFRLDTIQAAVLLVKLPHLERWHAARRERAAYYDEKLPEVVKTPRCVYGREHHVYNQYVISVGRDRDGLRAHLADQGIASSIFYPVPFHLQECFADLGYRRGDLPASEHAADHTLALPIYPELTPKMQDHVIDQIARFFR